MQLCGAKTSIHLFHIPIFDGSSILLMPKDNKNKVNKPAFPGFDGKLPGLDLGDNRFAAVWQKFLSSLGSNPDLMSEMSKRHGELMASLTSLDESEEDANGDASRARSKRGGRRFSHPGWEENPFYKYLKGSYDLNSEMLERAADSVELEAQERQALDFLLKQLKSSMSPANFPMTNPEVVEATIETKGENLRKGLENYIGDLRSGAITLSDPEAFVIGENLATTAGKVVAQNHLFQLIEYTPATAKVHAKPLLIVPPCINKYYILDLSERDSYVKHLVDQGFRVFLISWVNAGVEQQMLDWDDYVAGGVIEAIESVCAITRQDSINTLGYCIGGTLLSCAQALLKSNGDKRLETMSLMTAFVDFCDTGDIGLFVDEKFVSEMEDRFKDGGLLPGADLKRTFAYLRPDELVWPYVVSNYMLGKTPQPFNILHWNSDSTNLPGRMYAWYLRNTYLENRLVDGVEVCGQLVKVDDLGVPGMVISSERDHIVPWEAAYASAKALGSRQATFVLANSGHVAGVVNPPSKEKGYHYMAKAAKGAKASRGPSALPADPQAWLGKAQKLDGSWWPSFCAYLAARSGPKVAAPTKHGDLRHRPLQNAPGSYVTAQLPELQ